MKILNYDDIKSLLHLVKDEADYPELTLLENSVIAAIQSYLGRILKKGSYEQVFHTYFSNIALDALPVDSITSIITESGISIPTGSYRIIQNGVRIDEVYVMDESITIKYIGGYSKMPDDIYRAILLQTAYEFQNHDHIGASSVSNEGGTVQIPALGLIPEVVRLIKNHKNILKAFI